MTETRRPHDVAKPLIRLVPAASAPPVSSKKSIVLLDISRLIWRGRRVGPTGIDRVELAYAEHFIIEQSDYPTYAVLHLFGFLFTFSRAGARRFIEDLGARWRGRSPVNRRCHLGAVFKAYLRLFTSGWISGLHLRRIIRSHTGQPIYMVVSH